ncbi:MAG TPA: DUF1028 domain-containing protein [Gaiellales bacterium]|nr:DUF1028 domain-containing protein [Gaiellales bacterium]
MTLSLVGCCGRTGMLGAIVASSSPAVASRCARARARVGAACSQNITDPSLGPALLDRIAAGASAADALAAVTAATPLAAYRQLTVVDAFGRAAAFSGECTLGRHGDFTAAGCAAAGNLLADDSVPAAMAEAFAADPDADLGDRLVAALTAGRDAGGEAGPVHSAGMLVCDAVTWPVTDLRVDWTEADPVAALADLWARWQPLAAVYVARALDPASAPSYGVPGDE